MKKQAVAAYASEAADAAAAAAYLYPSDCPSGSLPYLAYAHLDVVPVENWPKKAGTTGTGWRVDPWSGAIQGGEIWGRGAIDDKQAVLGHLEAIEDLLSQGLMTAGPERTVYLCFGHDEEVGGHAGAAKVASLLREYGVRCDFLLDEGLFVVDGCLPQVTRPVALVGTQEKGSVTLEMSVEVEPGHASKPGREGAIGLMARAVKRLEGHPMPGHFDNVRPLLEAVAGSFRWPMQFVFANLWLFRGPLQRIFLAQAGTAAMVRTTTAVTMFRAGEKSNVLPATASAVVNHRIHPADSVAAVLAHDEAVLRGDMAWHHYSFAPSFLLLLSAAQWACLGWPLAYVAASPALLLAWVLTSLLAVTVPPWLVGRVLGAAWRPEENLLYDAAERPWGVKIATFRSTKAFEPSPRSSTTHDAYRDLRLSTFEVFNSACIGRDDSGGSVHATSAQKQDQQQQQQQQHSGFGADSSKGVLFAPALMIGGTDSKHFLPIVNQAYRFNPILLHMSETNMFHGHNERIGVESYARLVAFFRTFHLRSQERGSDALRRW